MAKKALLIKQILALGQIVDACDNEGPKLNRVSQNPYQALYCFTHELEGMINHKYAIEYFLIKS